MSARQGENRGYRFGFDIGPRLASGVGPKGFPGSVFIFFSSLLLFFFLFSYFFHRFCKNVPNQFKPLSEILQKSLQGFKSVGKQVFKIKTRFLIKLWIGAKGFACIKLNRILR
jgi:hypothetical protein